MSRAWKASDTTQYATIGRRSCRSVSEIPGISEGRGVRIYDGRGGSSKPSVVLENMLNAKTGRLPEAAAKSSRQRRVVTDKFKVEVDEQQKGARASLATVRLVGSKEQNRQSRRNWHERRKAAGGEEREYSPPLTEWMLPTASVAKQGAGANFKQVKPT